MINCCLLFLGLRNHELVHVFFWVSMTPFMITHQTLDISLLLLLPITILQRTVCLLNGPNAEYKSLPGRLGVGVRQEMLL